MAKKDEKLLLELERLNVTLGAVKDSLDNARTRHELDEFGDNLVVLQTALQATTAVAEGLAGVIRVNRELRVQLDEIRAIASKIENDKQEPKKLES